jgi:dienelactone hydrolase
VGPSKFEAVQRNMGEPLRLFLDSLNYSRHKHPLDRGIPSDDVRAYEMAITNQGKPNEIMIYEGAGHAFMNPGNSRGYNEAAAKTAWKIIDNFFDKNLK